MWPLAISVVYAAGTAFGWSMCVAAKRGDELRDGVGQQGNDE